MVRGADRLLPGLAPRFTGLSLALRLRECSRFGQSQKGNGRGIRRVSALLPILQRSHRYPEQVSELRLAQLAPDALYVELVHLVIIRGFRIVSSPRHTVAVLYAGSASVSRAAVRFLSSMYGDSSRSPRHGIAD